MLKEVDQNEEQLERFVRSIVDTKASLKLLSIELLDSCVVARCSVQILNVNRDAEDDANGSQDGEREARPGLLKRCCLCHCLEVEEQSEEVDGCKFCREKCSSYRRTDANGPRLRTPGSETTVAERDALDSQSRHTMVRDA